MKFSETVRYSTEVAGEIAAKKQVTEHGRPLICVLL